MNKLTYEKHQPKYIGQDMMEFLANAKFEDLPEDWTCPLCAVGKDQFSAE